MWRSWVHRVTGQDAAKLLINPYIGQLGGWGGGVELITSSSQRWPTGKTFNLHTEIDFCCDHKLKVNSHALFRGSLYSVLSRGIRVGLRLRWLCFGLSSYSSGSIRWWDGTTDRNTLLTITAHVSSEFPLYISIYISLIDDLFWTNMANWGRWRGVCTPVRRPISFKYLSVNDCILD